MLRRLRIMEKKLTKEEYLKSLKKMYNKHLMTYKQYMLETKKVEKYWKEDTEEEKVELPVNPEQGGFIPAPSVKKPDYMQSEEVELPVNPEL